MEKYFGNEKVENNKLKVEIPFPKSINKDDIKVTHSRNTYYISYSKEEKKEEEGMKSRSLSQGYYSRTLPFEISDAQAQVEGNRLVITFDKGKELMEGYNEVPVKKP